MMDRMSCFALREPYLLFSYLPLQLFLSRHLRADGMWCRGKDGDETLH